MKTYYIFFKVKWDKNKAIGYGFDSKEQYYDMNASVKGFDYRYSMQGRVESEHYLNRKQNAEELDGKILKEYVFTDYEVMQNKWNQVVKELFDTGIVVK